MVSRFSPPMLYLSDDEEEEDNEPEPNISYGDPYTSVMNNHLPRKKRRLPDANVRLNPSIVNWSKRQRSDHYHPHQYSTQNSIHRPEPETIAYRSDIYDFADQESHSFHAFDWTAEPQTRPRNYPNSISQMTIIPPPHVMNVVKHHLDQSDAVPIIQMSRQNERYVQQAPRKSMNIPISTTPPPPPPLVLPLPTPTSSLIRPQVQRVHSGKNLRIPYLHSTPPPLQPIHRPNKSVFSSPPITTTAYHPPTHAPISTSEILRQALHGTGVLSAFYDSKCYRCNICKFVALTSSKLLQHLFTHIFFCHQCPFYSYSQHNLYQHIFDKHHSHSPNDNIDPKGLELLYITRCSDGTFALCMDSSPTPPTTSERVIPPPEINNNVKTPKRKPRTKQPVNNPIVVLPEKSVDVPQPSSSSSSTTVAKRSIPKEKASSTYVLMKHRRCYSSRSLPCLHSLTLEYNICREHTVRHMCRTYGRFSRRRFLSKLRRRNLINQVAICLKTVVNQIVDIEENRDSLKSVCLLPNGILNSIFRTADLQTMTDLLQLTNKYDRSIEQNSQNHLESAVRSSNQHIFILSSTGISKNEQSVVPKLHTSITNADCVFTETKLNKLPISYDNTNRFLKGSLNLPAQSANLVPKLSTTNDVNPQPKNPESIAAPVLKSPQHRNSLSTSSKLDNNNNSLISSKPRSSPSPTVIVID